MGRRFCQPRLPTWLLARVGVAYGLPNIPGGPRRKPVFICRPRILPVGGGVVLRAASHVRPTLASSETDTGMHA